MASIVGALVVVPLGPAPGRLVTSPAFDLFWWAALSTAYVFVGSACVMLLVQRRPRTEAIPTRLLDVYVQLLVTAVCLGVVFTFDDLPLTWIVLLPGRLGRAEHGPVDLGGLQPHRHAGRDHRPGDPGRRPAYGPPTCATS